MVCGGGVREDGGEGGVKGIEAEGSAQAVAAWSYWEAFSTDGHFQNMAAGFLPDGRYGTLAENLGRGISVIRYPLVAAVPYEPEVCVAVRGGGTLKAHHAVKRDNPHAGQDVFYVHPPFPENAVPAEEEKTASASYGPVDIASGDPEVKDRSGGIVRYDDGGVRPLHHVVLPGGVAAVDEGDAVGVVNAGRVGTEGAGVPVGAAGGTDDSSCRGGKDLPAVYPVADSAVSRPLAKGVDLSVLYEKAPEKFLSGESE